jgi:hypothetical protein
MPISILTEEFGCAVVGRLLRNYVRMVVPLSGPTGRFAGGHFPAAASFFTGIAAVKDDDAIKSPKESEVIDGDAHVIAGASSAVFRTKAAAEKS